MEKIYKRPPKGFTENDTKKRIDWVHKATNLDFSQTLEETPNDLQGIIEQHLGFHTIPMAIASPLFLLGDYTNGYYMLPVCTVEGTLVYSLTRGMMATADSGGITVRHLGQKISRAPVFRFSSISEVKPFIEFINKNFKGIKNAAEATTRYGKLLEIKQTVINSMVILEMVYNTGNAAGQNMITIASKAACMYIQRKYDDIKYFLESGLNCDKKLSRRTMSVGRGHSIVAEAKLSDKVLQRLLHVDREGMRDFYSMGAQVCQVTGTLGMQLHIANALTAIYIAMGQDVACVAENSLGNLEMKENKDSVTWSLTLPSLTIGTVGGGVRLPSQRRNLETVGCHEGEHSSKKLAEIIGGAALCLELSLMSAIVSDTFAEAHKTYGRK